MTASLTQKVSMINQVNCFANDFYAKLHEILTPFVGKRIVGKTGLLIKSVAEHVPSDFGSGVDIIERVNHHGVMFTLRTARTSDNGTCYHTDHVVVGEVEDGVLIRLYPVVIRKSDYDADEIRSMCTQYQALIEQADKIKTTFLQLGLRDYV